MKAQEVWFNPLLPDEPEKGIVSCSTGPLDKARVNSQIFTVFPYIFFFFLILVVSVKSYSRSVPTRNKILVRLGV